MFEAGIVFDGARRSYMNSVADEVAAVTSEEGS